MSIYIIPVIIILLIVYSTIKKNNTYASFVAGAKSAFDLMLSLFPFLVAILVVIEIYNVSGLNIIVADALSPVFLFLGIPKELCELVIIKNFSGSGSLAILEDVFLKYGVDSYVGRCASVIMGTSEAVFFVSAVYFSKTKIQKLGYAIPLALLVNFISMILSCFFCRII